MGLQTGKVKKQDDGTPANAFEAVLYARDATKLSEELASFSGALSDDFSPAEAKAFGEVQRILLRFRERGSKVEHRLALEALRGRA